MLECLNGGGFSSKCKSRIKLIRSRIEVITRKKNATLKYLKKDIAALLQNGLDTNACERGTEIPCEALFFVKITTQEDLWFCLTCLQVEGLIKEMDHTTCYELIEQFCVCILGQLSSMKKHWECPPECREAVSSLIFAAARFADLPELCDLRSIFTERYGNLLECVNQEFSNKIASKPSSMEQKLNLMRDISQEFAINWDPKTYRERNSNPPLALPYNQPKLLEAAHDSRDHNVFKTQMQEIPSKQRQDISLVARHGVKQEVKTENEMDIIGQNNNGRRSPALDVDHGRTLAEKVKPRVAHSIAPHARQEVKADKKTSYPFNSHASKQLASDLTRESAGGLKLQSAEDIAPPYMKAKDSNYLRKPEIQHPNSGHGELPILPICHKDDLCTESMRKAGSDFNNYKRHGNGRPPNGCQDEIDRSHPVGDPTHIPKSMRRHPKPRAHKSDPSADGMEYGSRTPNGKTRQRTGLSILTQLDDEEEMVMDELLMHYSKTPSSTWKSNTILTGQRMRAGQKAPIYGVKDAGKWPQLQKKDGSDSAHDAGLTARALSLPSESAALKDEEVSKVPVRAASLQNPSVTHVHPKLPDYDDLAARFAAFKREGCKVK